MIHRQRAGEPPPTKGAKPGEVPPQGRNRIMNGQAARETKSHKSEAGRQDQKRVTGTQETVKPGLGAGARRRTTRPAGGCTEEGGPPSQGHPKLETPMRNGVGNSGVAVTIGTTSGTNGKQMDSPDAQSQMAQGDMPGRRHRQAAASGLRTRKVTTRTSSSDKCHKLIRTGTGGPPDARSEKGQPIPMAA